MDVSIIIVNYNTEKLILDCLDSIYEKTEGLDFEIIVVDNDSPNKPEILKSDNRIKYIQSEKNLGFGKANNLGAEYATGEYLFCLNPDTLLVNNAIKELYDFMETHHECGICGANLFHEDMTPTHSYEILKPGILQELINSRTITSKRFNEQFNTSSFPQLCSYVTGATLFIKKELFMRVGGYDQDFFMYYEDTYLCHIISKLGLKIYNVPKAMVIHLEGRSSVLRKHIEDMYFEGRKKYLIKTYGITYFCLANLVGSFNLFINVIYSTLNGKVEERKKWIYKWKKLIKIYY